MNSLEMLKQEIENQLLVTKGMTEVIKQSQKLDRMIEQYLDMTN